MGCPTCQHTMQNLGVHEQRIFWCPRCGTLKEYSGEDFFRVEQTTWIRNIVSRSNIEEGKKNKSQHTSVEVVYKVDQFDIDLPRLEQRIEAPSGRRVF
jgi:Zn-finger nucleic acid-binding protein